MQRPQKLTDKDGLDVILCVLERPIFSNFYVTIEWGTFPPGGKNMFFSLPQRPLQATYGKSIILRL